MPTYTYTKLADFILDQLWGYASANAIKNSLRYIAEDVLGDPSANSDKLSPTSANNVGTQMTSTGANNIINQYTRSTGTSVGLRGIALSSGSGTFNLNSTTFTDVTNLSVTITTSGRPIFIGLIPDTVSNTVFGVSKIGAGSAGDISLELKFLRDATTLFIHNISHSWNPNDTVAQHVVHVPCGALNTIDVVGAGTYVYKMQARCTNTDAQANISRVKIIAFEL